VALFVVVSLLLALGAGAGALLAVRHAEATRVVGTWIDAMRPEVRNGAATAMLRKRADAVRARDKAAFMADIATSDPGFAHRQEVVYENLTKLPLAELSFDLEAEQQYDSLIDRSLAARYRSLVKAVGVTVHYRIEGVDSVTVAAPWVPIFGFADGRWQLAGELSDRTLPYGTRGQPWDGGPIEVVKSARVVAILSADDAGRAKFLLDESEAGLTKVAKIRPAGWDGKVLLTAVQDQRIFDAYFGDSPERVAKVAAIAVPYYDRVTDWHDAPAYATTRVFFNPQELSAEETELSHDLTHEITHAAMGPVTNAYTPRWIVEGFAEYVAYKGITVDPRRLSEALREVDVSGGLPGDGDFYSNSHNYLTAWIACRMIAEKYGEKKLIAYYESFLRAPSADANAQATLGVDLATLTTQWRGTISRLEK
jgi:hypothetical protein